MVAALTFDAKKSFFDRNKVASAMDRVTRFALNRFGASTRATARYSIKRRKKISRPGQPPHYHTRGGANIRTIFYAWDSSRRSVVVGPVRFNSARRGRQTTPELLEVGGTTRTKRGRAKYRPRPFMEPAFDRTLPQLKDFYKQARGRFNG